LSSSVCKVNSATFSFVSIRASFRVQWMQARIGPQAALFPRRVADVTAP
jgi:hypothetical protein